MKGNRSGNLYVLQQFLGATATVSSSKVSDLYSNQLWHMRERGVTIFSKQGLLFGQKKRKSCTFVSIVFGKQCRVKFSTAVCHTKGTVNYFHCDLWHPSEVQSKGGSRYFMSIIDDYS